MRNPLHASHYANDNKEDKEDKEPTSNSKISTISENFRLKCNGGGVFFLALHPYGHNFRKAGVLLEVRFETALRQVTNLTQLPLSPQEREC